MKNKEYADKCFDAIMQLQGVDELKDLARRLKTFQINKEYYSVPGAKPPNYLWVAKRGGGVTTCLDVFSEYLYAMQIIEFTGIVKYFEFIPAYTEPEHYFSELTRLNNTITEIAGHNRYFKGIACIILDEWLKSTGEINFKSILDYLDNKNDKILTIFCVHTDNVRIIKDLETAIASYMRSETVTLRFPNTEELIKYIEETYFERNHLTLAKDARALLAESIGEIAAGKYFNGFKTINQLADDIIYSLLESDINAHEITADMIRGFKKGTAYIKRIKTSGGKYRIGFTLKEENEK